MNVGMTKRNSNREGLFAQREDKEQFSQSKGDEVNA